MRLKHVQSCIDFHSYDKTSKLLVFLGGDQKSKCTMKILYITSSAPLNVTKCCIRGSCFWLARVTLTKGQNIADKSLRCIINTECWIQLKLLGQRNPGTIH